LGEETAKDIDDEYFCVELDSIAVKGKKDAVRIYTALSTQKYMWHNTNWVHLEQQHEKFLVFYRNQKWILAEKWAQDLETAWPIMSVYYSIMLERIEKFKSNPPGNDWDGVYHATTK